MQETTPDKKKGMYDELFGRKEERVFTDEDVELMKERIGIDMVSERPFNQECTRDNLRHLAQGNGDINPLFFDEEYARNTRWGGLVAPPTFMHCTGTTLKRALTAEERARGAGALRGIQALYSGDDCYYYRPLHPGDFVWTRAYLNQVYVKQSEFTGRTVFTIHRRIMANQRGELICAADMLVIWAGRQRKVGERKKYAAIKKQYYTPEDIMRIDADMDREEVRGANPRYWEDVNEGDELTPVVKGPLSVADMVNFDIGHGMTMYDGSHHVAYEYRKRHPAAFPLNEYGIPDTVESVHWVDKLGKQVTNVAAYDYGEQRYAWLSHVVTNWMGDDAWLYHIDGQWRKFVYLGDTNWVKGKVASKYIDEHGQYKVDLDIWCEDQRGLVTAPGHATVILPSRVGGLPQVPPVDTPAPFQPEEVAVAVGDEPIWRTRLF